MHIIYAFVVDSGNPQMHTTPIATRIGVSHDTDCTDCACRVRGGAGAPVYGGAVMVTYRPTRTTTRIPAYDILDGGKRIATVHSFDVVQTVCRELASRNAKAAAAWAVAS